MVGTPVHRQRVAPGLPPVEDSEERDEYSLDGKPEWDDRPTFPDQLFRGPDYWKFDRMDVKVFDMSKPEEAKEYSELLTAVNTTGSNKFIINTERKFSEDIHNWRIFVEIQFIKYRKLLKMDKKP